MSQLPGVDASTAGLTPSPGGGDPLTGLDMDHFLTLMIAELQNQDPLNPLENNELMQQISQIREIGATEKLSQTLEAVLLGQNVASATNLIGKEVRALTDTGETVIGTVERVTILGGEPRLQIGTQEVSLSNVAEIRSGTDAGTED